MEQEQLGKADGLHPVQLQHNDRTGHREDSVLSGVGMDTIPNDL